MPGELTNCDNKDPGEPTIPVISDISSSLEGSLDKLIIPFKSKISSPNEPPINFKFSLVSENFTEIFAAETGSSEKSKTVWPFKNSESFAFALPSSAIFDNLFLATLTPQLDSLIKFLNSEISDTVSPL